MTVLSLTGRGKCVLSISIGCERDDVQRGGVNSEDMQILLVSGKCSCGPTFWEKLQNDSFGCLADRGQLYP